MIRWIPRMIVAHTIVDRPGTTTCRHRHHYVQAGYVQTGMLTVHLNDDRRLEVRPHEFFNIAQCQDHVIAVGAGRDTRTIDLRFQMVLDDSTVHRPRLACNAGLQEMAGFSFVIARPQARRLRGILAAMVDATRLATVDGRTLLAGMELLSLAAAILDCPREPRIPLAHEPESSRAVMRAIKCIREQFARRLDVSILADKAGISVGHLERLFRRFTGLSPKQYLLRYRVDQAKRLMLVQDGMALKQVAYQTGFPDLQQFSRVFRRLEGCPPSQFLRA